MGKMLALAGILFLSACQADDTNRYNPILTAKDEAELGDALATVALSIPEQFPILSREDFPEAYDYLDSVLGMVVIKTQIRNKFNWDIFILDNDFSKNAFALPGGKIFITTGFLKYLRSEHQLIALVAHEAYYADRSEQTRQDELSTTMYKLKESDDYGTLGTRVFTEVMAGNDAEAPNMIHLASATVYEPYEVLAADAFYLSLICENYLYSGFGIEELIDKVEADASIQVFEWFENKPPVPNNLLNGNSAITGPFRDDRIAQISEAAAPENCGTENTVQNTANYLRFLEDLP